LPVRSISYYNKGEVLGFLLDLEMRRASNGSKSLRDLFRWMNENYARRERYFSDSEGVREAAEALTGSDFRSFFRAYVAGVQELPYDEALATVGLKLQHTNRISATTGFESVRNFDTAPVVVSVAEGSDAAKAGLTAGDSILEINGRQAAAEVEDMIAGKQPGDNIKLRVQGRSGVRDVKLKLGARREEDFKIVELENATPAQRARRAAWLASEPEPTAAAAAAK
jgi:predicted metalloprotease with PDZ domain